LQEKVTWNGFSELWIDARGPAPAMPTTGLRALHHFRSAFIIPSQVSTFP